MSQESLLYLKEKGDNSRTSTGLCMDINLSFITLLHTRSQVQYFLRYLFIFLSINLFCNLSCAHLRLHTNDAQICSSCFQIQHESTEESIKEENKKREEMK